MLHCHDPPRPPPVPPPLPLLPSVPPPLPVSWPPIYSSWPPTAAAGRTIAPQRRTSRASATLGPLHVGSVGRSVVLRLRDSRATNKKKEEPTLRAIAASRSVATNNVATAAIRPPSSPSRCHRRHCHRIAAAIVMPPSSPSSALLPLAPSPPLPPPKPTSTAATAAAAAHGPLDRSGILDMQHVGVAAAGRRAWAMGSRSAHLCQPLPIVIHPGAASCSLRVLQSLPHCSSLLVLRD